MHDWRPVLGFEDRYEVNEVGEVRWRTDLRGKLAGRLLKAYPSRAGYLRVLLRRSNKNHQRAVHILVCHAWHGPRPSPIHQVAHGDGNQVNNRFTNLRWATPKENRADAIAHGTQVHGTRCHSAQLNEAAVRTIRRKRKAGSTLAELGDQFGVTKQAIRKVVNFKSWRHVK